MTSRCSDHHSPRCLEFIPAWSDESPWTRSSCSRYSSFQVIRGLSDEALEFHLNDSASAQRFIGRSPHDTMPDSTSIWLFRDKLAAARVTRSDDGTDSPGEEIDGVRALFDVFHQQLADKGLLCREGKTVDAMIVEVPRQRNSRKENESIKNGEVPDAWKGQPRKLAQKDTDARWTKKRNVTYFGYKDSVVGGITDCFVHDYVVSAAQHHDSQIMPGSLLPGSRGGSRCLR